MSWADLGSAPLPSGELQAGLGSLFHLLVLALCHKIWQHNHLRVLQRFPRMASYIYNPGALPLSPLVLKWNLHLYLTQLEGMDNLLALDKAQLFCVMKLLSNRKSCSLVSAIQSLWLSPSEPGPLAATGAPLFSISPQASRWLGFRPQQRPWPIAELSKGTSPWV